MKPVTYLLDDSYTITIPRQALRELDIKSGDEILLRTNNYQILLEKPHSLCSCCGKRSNEELQLFGRVFLCRSCIQKIGEYKTPEQRN